MEHVDTNMVNAVARELCITIAAEVEDAKAAIRSISKIVCSDVPVADVTYNRN